MLDPLITTWYYIRKDEDGYVVGASKAQVRKGMDGYRVRSESTLLPCGLTGVSTHGSFKTLLKAKQYVDSLYLNEDCVGVGVDEWMEAHAAISVAKEYIAAVKCGLIAPLKEGE